MSSLPIKYVLIGDTNSSQIITEYTITKSPQTQTEAKQIFEKLSKSPEKRVEERNKIQGKQGNYYFTIAGQNNIFYLVLVDTTYPERYVFDLIDNINKDHIYLMVNEKNELNASGRQMLKNHIDRYQDEDNLNSIKSINSEVEDIKIDMNNNIRKVIGNVDDIKNLEVQSNRIKNNASEYKKNAKDLERTTWWQNCKLTIIIGVIVIAVLLAIIIPLVTRD